MRKAIDYDFPDSDTSDKFKLGSVVPDAILNLFFYGPINFLSVMDLIYTSEDTRLYDNTISKALFKYKSIDPSLISWISFLLSMRIL